LKVSEQIDAESVMMMMMMIGMILVVIELTGIVIKINTYVSTIYLFIHKATCFGPSVGHLQAYIAD
jgi:hypothetical protein